MKMIQGDYIEKPDFALKSIGECIPPPHLAPPIGPRPVSSETLQRVDFSSGLGHTLLLGSLSSELTSASQLVSLIQFSVFSHGSWGGVGRPFPTPPPPIILQTQGSADLSLPGWGDWPRAQLQLGFVPWKNKASGYSRRVGRRTLGWDLARREKRSRLREPTWKVPLRGAAWKAGRWAGRASCPVQTVPAHPGTPRPKEM